MYSYWILLFVYGYFYSNLALKSLSIHPHFTRKEYVRTRGNYNSHRHRKKRKQRYKENIKTTERWTIFFLHLWPIARSCPLSFISKVRGQEGKKVDTFSLLVKVSEQQLNQTTVTDVDGINKNKIDNISLIIES